MASTTAGVRLTERHRTRQVALRASFLLELHRVWPLLDPLRLDQTARAWLDLAMDLITAFWAQSRDVSLDYYDRFRTVETGADALDIDAVRELIEFDPAAARASLIATGPARIKHRTRLGEDPFAVARTGLLVTSGAASRHVLNGGRDAVVTAGSVERTPIGYFRVTDANPCGFCAMLASRGDESLYLTEDTGLRTTHRSVKRGPGEKYHDDCNCTVEPVFSRDQAWPGRNREFEALWKKSTEGLGGNDALNAFRTALRHRDSIEIPTQRIPR
jgi:hypothetical protein